jgi:hypothetical protein
MKIHRWFPVVLVIISLAAAALACAPGGAAPAQPEAQIAVEQPTEQVIVPTPTPETSPTPTKTPRPPTPTPEPTETPTQAPLTAGDVAATAAVSEPVVIEASGDSAEAIDQAWQQAYELPAGVPFSVTISSAQIQAKVNQAMALSPYGGSNFTNLNVVLDNGQVGMTFGFTLGATGRSLNGSAFFNVTVNSQGEIVVTVASAEVTGSTIGSFSIPPEMLTALNEALTLAFAGTSVQEQAGVPGQVVFTSVVIDDGYATITGYVVPEM